MTTTSNQSLIVGSIIARNSDARKTFFFSQYGENSSSAANKIDAIVAKALGVEECATYVNLASEGRRANWLDVLVDFPIREHMAVPEGARNGSKVVVSASALSDTFDKGTWYPNNEVANAEISANVRKVLTAMEQSGYTFEVCIY